VVVALVQWWEGKTTCLQKVKMKQYILSFLDDSLQYLCDSVLATHSLRLLLTQLSASSLYNLDPNGLRILMTNNANIFINHFTIQKYFGTCRY